MGRKNTGKLFQKNIERSLLPTTFYYRLKDSPGAWSQGENSRFTPKNLCDYVIFFDGCLFMTEAKSTKGKSLSFSNISNSQLDGFKKLEKKMGSTDNLYGLFLIEFSELKETYAIYSTDVISYIESASRKSFPVDLLRDVGVKLEMKKGKRKQVEIEKGIKKLNEKSSI